MRAAARIAIMVLALFVLLPHPVPADEIIRVLILAGPHGAQPSEEAQALGKLNGEILFGEGVYSGRAEVSSDASGLHLVMVMPFELYIQGVVAAETGDDWAEEALKAQAVISRTYALFQKRHAKKSQYHLTSSVLHQAYSGGAASELIQRAVQATEGEVLTYEDSPIEAFYHSTCSGQTELPAAVWGKDYPYIVSVPCGGEHSPYAKWQRRFSMDELEKAVGFNNIRDVTITAFTSTGRAQTLKIAGEEHELAVQAVDLRRLLGYRDLPSTSFSLSVERSEIIFEGGGYGHGVGLSQWGALEMAHEGKTYREILRHYYPKAALTYMGSRAR